MLTSEALIKHVSGSIQTVNTTQLGNYSTGIKSIEILASVLLFTYDTIIRILLSHL